MPLELSIPVGTVLLFLLNIIGMAFTSKMRAPLFFSPAVGFMLYILLTQFISGVTRISAGKIGIATLAILAVIGCLFLIGHLSLVKNFAVCFLVQELILVIVLFISYLSRSQYGVGNFDMMVALQDGRFLTTNNVHTNGPITQSVLPLVWNAEGGTRYGISYLVAAIHFVYPSLNLLIVGESLLLLFFAISIPSLYALLSSTTKKKNAYIWISIGIANLSSLIVLQIKSQMFGQITVIPLMYFSMWVLFQFKDQLSSVKLFFPLSLTLLAIFLIYLPIFVVVFGITSIILLFHLIQSRDHISLVKFFVSVCSCFLLMFLTSLEQLFIRFWDWIKPYTLSSKPMGPDFFFGQFSSFSAPSQILGITSFPFFGPWSSGFVVMNICLFLTIIAIMRNFFKSDIFDDTSFLKKYLMIVLVFILIAWIANSPYTVLKLAIWHSQLFWSIAVLCVLSGAFSFFAHKRHTGILFAFSGVVIAVLISLNLTVSKGYISNIQNSGSFQQLISMENAKAFYNFKLPLRGFVGILQPSVEEAAWAGSSFPDASQHQLLAIGYQRTASKYFSVKSCDNGLPLKIAKKSSYLVYNRNSEDITPRIALKNNSQSKIVDDWYLTSTANVANLLVPASGFWPVTLQNQLGTNPIPESQNLRWSSGGGCFLFYSSTENDISLKGVGMVGPEFEPEASWLTNLDKFKFSREAASNTFRFQGILKVTRGWNQIQIERSDTSLNRFTNSRFFGVRADARKLNFAIGTITYESLSK
jgi:hypothetical protein